MNNVNSNNWKDYKKEGVIFFVALFLSVLLIVVFLSQYDDLQQEESLIKQRHEQLVKDVEEATEDKTVLKETGESFRKLKQQGFYGEEDRLALTETLKNTADKLKLPNFKYSISPQQQIDNVGSGFSRKLLLLQSVVNVEAELPHEGDFVQLGEDLSSLAEGAYIVKSCELAREKELTMTELTKNVGLTCAFVFYTVQLSSSESEEEEVDDIDLGGEE